MIRLSISASTCRLSTRILGIRLLTLKNSTVPTPSSKKFKERQHRAQNTSRQQKGRIGALENTK